MHLRIQKTAWATSGSLSDLPSRGRAKNRAWTDIAGGYGSRTSDPPGGCVRWPGRTCLALEFSGALRRRGDSLHVFKRGSGVVFLTSRLCRLLDCPLWFSRPGWVLISHIFSSAFVQKASMGGKNGWVLWNTFHLWQRKVFTFHMWNCRSTWQHFEENLRKLFTVFKLATTDAYWHSLMEGEPRRPFPCQSYESTETQGGRQMENRMPALLETKRMMEMEATVGFLKLFPSRIRLAFPLSYWQHWKKDIFLLGVRTFILYGRKYNCSLCTHFGLLKGSRKMGYESSCALSPALQWDLGASARRNKQRNRSIWGNFFFRPASGT